MKMQEKKLKRFSLYSKIANVLFILFIIAGIFGVLAGLGVFAYTKIENVNFATHFLREFLPNKDAGVFIIGGADTIIPNGVLFTMIFFGVFAIAFAAFVIKIVANMFKRIVEAQTPFNVNIVRSLKIVAIAFFAQTGLSFIFSAVMYSGIAQAITLVGFSGIDYKSLLFGILIFTLAEIFEFGMGLQHDSESIV